MILRANCKINLGLDVLRRRADGYHDLETAMFPVRGLFDEVEGPVLTCTRVVTVTVELAASAGGPAASVPSP